MRQFLSLSSADLDETESCILLWALVGGSSSGRTSVSGSDYLGSIPSPPANNLSRAVIFRSPSRFRTALGDRLAVGRRPLEPAT